MSTKNDWLNVDNQIKSDDTETMSNGKPIFMLVSPTKQVTTPVSEAILKEMDELKVSAKKFGLSRAQLLKLCVDEGWPMVKQSLQVP